MTGRLCKWQNILLAAGLFSIHHKTLGLQNISWRRADSPDPNKRKRSTPNGSIHQPSNVELIPPIQTGHLYWSLCICVVIVFINITNSIICEVGEWQHWISHAERDQLRTFLSVLATQGKCHVISLASRKFGQEQKIRIVKIKLHPQLAPIHHHSRYFR